jgi:hypothetical protein
MTLAAGDANGASGARRDDVREGLLLGLDGSSKAT